MRAGGPSSRKGVQGLHVAGREKEVHVVGSRVANEPPHAGLGGIGIERGDQPHPGAVLDDQESQAPRAPERFPPGAREARSCEDVRKLAAPDELVRRLLPSTRGPPRPRRAGSSTRLRSRIRGGRPGRCRVGKVGLLRDPWHAISLDESAAPRITCAGSAPPRVRGKSRKEISRLTRRPGPGARRQTTVRRPTSTWPEACSGRAGGSRGHR